MGYSRQLNSLCYPSRNARKGEIHIGDQSTLGADGRPLTGAVGPSCHGKGATPIKTKGSQWPRCLLADDAQIPGSENASYLTADAEGFTDAGAHGDQAQPQPSRPSSQMSVARCLLAHLNEEESTTTPLSLCPHREGCEPKYFLYRRFVR